MDDNALEHEREKARRIGWGVMWTLLALTIIGVTVALVWGLSALLTGTG